MPQPYWQVINYHQSADITLPQDYGEILMTGSTAALLYVQYVHMTNNYFILTVITKLSPLVCYHWNWSVFAVLFPFWTKLFLLISLILFHSFLSLLSVCPHHTPPISVHYTDGLCWEYGQSTLWVLSTCLHCTHAHAHTKSHIQKKTI